LLLHRDGALNGADDGRKFEKHAVAGNVHDAPAMLANDAGYHGLVLAQTTRGADLVDAHQPAVSGNVSGDDRRELAFNALQHSGAPQAITPKSCNKRSTGREKSSTTSLFAVHVRRPSQF
jgi:hypothetical protein